MSQGTTHLHRDSHSTTTSTSRAKSRSSNSSSDSRGKQSSPRPTESRSHEQIPSQLSSKDQDQSPEKEIVSPGDYPASLESTSLLGSVWNLFRDVKDVAVKELDKLLERFPYQGNGSKRVSTGEDKASIRAQTPLTAQRPRSSVSAIPAKSLLGHGPRLRQRGIHLRNKNNSLSKKLLSQDFRNNVNDISSSSHIRVPSITYTDVSSNRDSNGRKAIKRTRRPSSSESETQDSSLPRPPHLQHRHAYSLKRGSSYSPYTSYSSYSSAHDRLGLNQDIDEQRSAEDDEHYSRHSDGSIYAPNVLQRTMLSREPSLSPTPSIASLAGILSITGRTQPESPRRPHSRQRHDAQYKRTHRQHTHYQHHPTQPTLPRYSLLGEPLHYTAEQDEFTTTAIYPPSSAIPGEGSTAREKSLSAPYFPSIIADPSNNPFVTSRGPSPLPSSFSAETSPDQFPRISPLRPFVEKDKLNELEQELAAIKEQLASLVSARNDDLGRAHSSPAHLNTSGLSPPPPPPPPSNLITPKKWAPPHNQANLSMINVLKELSSSKVQLRKTGSPFVSRISSAVEGSPSSKYTSLAIKSRSDLEAESRITAGLSPTVLSRPTIPALRSSSSPDSRRIGQLTAASVKPRRSASQDSEPHLSETAVDLQWPSPTTIHRADSWLDMAAKDLTESMYNRNLVLATSPSTQPSHQQSGAEVTDDSESCDPAPSTLTLAGIQSVSDGKRKRSSSKLLEESMDIHSTSIPSSQRSSTLEYRSGTGPRVAIDKRSQPTRSRTLALRRSITDPSQLNPHVQFLGPQGFSSIQKHVSFQSLTDGNDFVHQKDEERRWFRESDNDGWRVGA